MRNVLMVCAVVVVAGMLATAVQACPASWVRDIGNGNDPYYSGTEGEFEKASDVADGYMTEKGVNPSSPSGQVVKPYVVGTTLVESYAVGLADITADPETENSTYQDQVEQAVQAALGNEHIERHFFDGKTDAADGNDNTGSGSTGGG